MKKLNRWNEVFEVTASNYSMIISLYKLICAYYKTFIKNIQGKGSEINAPPFIKNK